MHGLVNIFSFISSREQCRVSPIYVRIRTFYECFFVQSVIYARWCMPFRNKKYHFVFDQCVSVDWIDRNGPRREQKRCRNECMSPQKCAKMCSAEACSAQSRTRMHTHTQSHSIDEVAARVKPNVHVPKCSLRLASCKSLQLCL